MVNPLIAFANFFGNLFNDPIGSIVHLFGDFADTILGVIESIAKALDKVFGSNMAGAVQGWRSGLKGMVEIAAKEYGNGSYEKIMDELDLDSETLGLKRWEYGKAWDFGYKAGQNIDDKISDLFGSADKTKDLLNQYDNLLDGIIPDDLLGNVSDIAGNTGNISDAMDITEEDLKCLRDLAERDAINKFTTAEIKIDMINNNTINSDDDIDGFIHKVTTKLSTEMETGIEGVHA